MPPLYHQLHGRRCLTAWALGRVLRLLCTCISSIQFNPGVIVVTPSVQALATLNQGLMTPEYQASVVHLQTSISR